MSRVWNVYSTRVVDARLYLYSTCTLRELEKLRFFLQSSNFYHEYKFSFYASVVEFKYNIHSKMCSYVLMHATLLFEVPPRKLIMKKKLQTIVTCEDSIFDAAWSARDPHILFTARRCSKVHHVNLRIKRRYWSRHEIMGTHLQSGRSILHSEDSSPSAEWKHIRGTGILFFLSRSRWIKKTVA